MRGGPSASSNGPTVRGNQGARQLCPSDGTALWRAVPPWLAADDAVAGFLRPNNRSVAACSCRRVVPASNVCPFLAIELCCKCHGNVLNFITHELFNYRKHATQPSGAEFTQ